MGSRFKGWKSPSGNNKIKNATKIESEGVKYDSKLELYMADLLRQVNIPFEFQKKFVLQDKFRYNGEAIREIRMVIDFWLPEHNMLIDTKGFQMADNKIKWKMLKCKLSEEPSPPVIVLPKNKKECQCLVLELKGSFQMKTT